MTKHNHHKENTPAEKEHDEKEKNQEQQEKMVSIPDTEYHALLLKQKEVQESVDRLLRLQADFENTRKRMERDRSEFIKFADEQVISELIPFVDDFQRAFDAADSTKDFNVLHKGVEMILNHLLEFLKRKGVTEIEAAGKPFDPRYHEAMLQVESDDYPENTVIEELQKGYMLNNRVVRTAKVKVSKSNQPQEEAEITDIPADEEMPREDTE
ncbi:MAG: nucleotide exchange factor GrpE [Candidatus Omnitrophica bacterium]|nr:nucleotide exchange factor GrpE [Candidatus Omnitrophota bacterium]MBU4478777.1 nucleotide exchange factor GrpE [Candidatus Omnitrophota bacterium]MCG2704076.1 nucleotide exchange factor GrpE [Candidatus Omnitrophota bacterium]